MKVESKYKDTINKNEFIRNSMNVGINHQFQIEEFINYGSLIIENHDDLIDGYTSMPIFQIAHIDIEHKNLYTKSYLVYYQFSDHLKKLLIF